MTTHVVCNDVHVIRQVLPSSANNRHPRLTLKLPFRSDLSRYSRHFVPNSLNVGYESLSTQDSLLERNTAYFIGERLIDHGIDRQFEVKHFPLKVHIHLFAEFAEPTCLCNFGNGSDLISQVRGHVLSRKIRGQSMRILRNERKHGHSRFLSNRPKFLDFGLTT